MAAAIPSIDTSSLLNSTIGGEGEGIHAGWSKFRGSAWYTVEKNDVASSTEKLGSVVPPCRSCLENFQKFVWH